MKLLLLKFVARIRAAVWRHVVICTGKGAWKFDVDGDDVKLTPVHVPKETNPVVIVVGRSQCYEIEKHIPIDSWLEARRVARYLAVSSPFEGIRKTHLVPDDRGGYTARIAIMNREVIQNVVPNRPVALIPSSWFFLALANGQSSEIEFAGETFGFACGKDTHLSMPLGSDRQKRDFWWAAGFDQTEVVTVPGDRALERLPVALRSLGFDQWIEAFQGNTSRSLLDFGFINWTSFSKALGLLVLSYMLLTSVFLGALGVWAENRAAHESSDFVQALALKGEINRLKSIDQIWQSSTGAQHAVWAIWPVINDISNDNVFVRNIRFEAGSVEASFIAKEATEILNVVLNSPYASNAKFSSAVVKDRQGEFDNFSIRWDVYDGAVATSEESGR